MSIQRRAFLASLGAIIAAPAIVRSPPPEPVSAMPLRVVSFPPADGVYEKIVEGMARRAIDLELLR